MKTNLMYRALRIVLLSFAGTLLLACVEKEIEKPDPATPPDPIPTTEQIEKQQEKDRKSIIDLVSSCITGDFNAETLVKEKLETIKALPTVKTVDVTSAGVHIKYSDDSEECILFDYGTAFDDETTQTNGINYAPSTFNTPVETKATGSKTIHFFNLFSNDSGRKNQNQLMKSAAEMLTNHGRIVEHPFADFTVNSLVSALEDENCVAIFISTIGDEYGHIAVGGEYYKKFDGYGMPNSSVSGELYTPLTPVGKNQVGSVVNQIVGHTYRGASLQYFLKNINSAKLAGKMVYLSSCHTLRADFGNYNVCLVGWDNVNMLGEAYALIMADYMGRSYFTLGSFLANFKNSPGGIEDKYTNSGATLRVKGAVKDFSFYRKDTCFSEPKRERLKPHKIQITSPDNGGCVNPFAIYSINLGGSALVYFDYLLDAGETVSLWHNTAPQGRVYFTHSVDFLKHDVFSSPLGMYQQKALDPYAVVYFDDPGVMKVSFYSQDKSDYKEKGPGDASHKLEDEIYIIAPRNYKKNDPVQNTDPAVKTLTVLRIDNSMYAYGGIVNMDGESLRKGFKLSKKGDDVTLGTDVPASNDGNLFYASLPNMKKGTEYTVMAYAVHEDGTYYGGEPLDFVSEVDSVIPTEPTPGDLIDLGLSVKWASCNLGATEPQDPGDYYAWGETQTKSNYNWSTYLLSNGSSNSLKKYCSQSSYGTVDNRKTLELTDDAAFVNTSGKMRMPTAEECRELRDKCQWTETKYKDRDGYLVYSVTTGNAIFIPKNGLKFSYVLNTDSPYYWTADLGTDESFRAESFLFPQIMKWDRCDGLGIRPVSNSQETDTPDVESITVNGVSFKMVKVDAGSFMMGSPDDDPDAGGVYSDEKPQHRVSLSSYAIGETEVTQALWKAVMGYNPSRNTGDDRPVEEVSWDEVQSFVEKLSKLTGRSFRLPTEAEWEYAARGGKYSKGYKYAGSNDVFEVSWNCENSDWMTHPVATKKPNELGLYDMSGNVWEWCQDWYDFSYYKNSPSENPCNTVASDYHIHRGGSFEYILTDLRIAMRGDYLNPPSNSMRGLRLVLSSISQSHISVPQSVDLGLSVKWASFNLGASKPEENGDYYSWGETNPKNEYSENTYKWYQHYSDYNAWDLTKYCCDPVDGYNGFTDDKDTLEPEDDAAHVNLGGKWRMPTKAEFEELIDPNNCSIEQYTINGVAGLSVTSLKTHKSIFLPFTGDGFHGQSYAGEMGSYWSSTIPRTNSKRAYKLFVNYRESYAFYIEDAYRQAGYSIRPVYDDK